MSIKVEKMSEPVALGEAPHWDERQQCLYYVSVQEKTIHKYVSATGEHTKTTLDGPVAFIVPIEGAEDRFVVGVDRKFLVVQWDGVEGSKVDVLKDLGEVDQDEPKNKICDGKADPRGRLLAGSMGYWEPTGEFQGQKSSLYRIDSSKGGEMEKVVQCISISNGLAWDLKESAFYYIDSLEKNIRRYDYNVETGEFSNLKYIFDLEKNNVKGIPDGELLLTVPIPAEQVTSVTFGGPGLDVLFVTTASMNIGGEQLPPCGSTFMVTGLGVKGHLNNKFKL